MTAPQNHDHESLNLRDIIQIDATVIVGALILLSIVNMEIKLPAVNVQNVFPGITMTIVLPFAVSAILAIIPTFGVHQLLESRWAQMRRLLLALSKFAMIAGFIYIISWIIILASYTP